MKKAAFIFIFIILTILIIFRIYENKILVYNNYQTENLNINSPSPIPSLIPQLTAKVIENNYHIFQTFNNCGPAALSMAFSYYGIAISQQQLGQDLRPYQNPQGNNDDKSVTLEELAQKAREFNLVPFHRPNGSIELIKQFITHDIPVITRTRLTQNDDIGHFRIIKGFANITQEFIQDDSLQGHSLKYSYVQFLKIWQIFNYEYLVLVPADKEPIARSILGENADIKTAWENAVKNSQKELTENPDNIYARFNLSIALYHTGDFKNAVLEFEQVENKLPFRTLWYQIEPIEAYYELGNYQRVFDMTDKIFLNQNRAFSELYVIRGEIYKKQGNLVAAKSEFEKSVFYNQNLKSAQQALEQIL